MGNKEAELLRIKALTQRADDRITLCLLRGKGMDSFSDDDIRYISNQLVEAANAGTEFETMVRGERRASR